MKLPDSAKEIPLRMLYVFAGAKRKADMEAVAQELVHITNNNGCGIHLNLTFDQWDVLRGGDSHDLTDIDLQRRLKGKVMSGDYDIIILSPPCESWSRVLFANNLGPAPRRSRRHPWGVWSRSIYHRKKISLANMLIEFTAELLLAAKEAHHEEDWRLTRGLLEHPEDLGDHKNGSPASIFQLGRIRDLVNLHGYMTGAMYQCWAAPVPYAKPTRFISDIPNLVKKFFGGWPASRKDGDMASA